MTLDKSLLPALKSFLPHEGLKMYMLGTGQVLPSLKIAFRRPRDPCQEGQAPRQRADENILFLVTSHLIIYV